MFESRDQPIQVISPYVLAAENYTAMSATAPIANPSTGVFVGQTILNFPPHEVQGLLDDMDCAVSFIITADGDYAVIGSRVLESEFPNYPFLYDEDAADQKKKLIYGILNRTEKGINGTDHFTRRMEDDSKETFTIAYEPVRARALLPLDPSDLSRGCRLTHVTIYTVGLAYSQTEIEGPWKEIEVGIKDELRRYRNVYISIIFSAVSLFALVACMVRTLVRVLAKKHSMCNFLSLFNVREDLICCNETSSYSAANCSPDQSPQNQRQHPVAHGWLSRSDTSVFIFCKTMQDNTHVEHRFLCRQSAKGVQLHLRCVASVPNYQR